MSRIDDLHTVAFTMTELMFNEEHAHLSDHWQMIFGSVLLPEIAKEDPNLLKEHPEYKTLMDMFTKDAVLKALEPKVIEKEVPVEKVIEKEVPVEKVIEKERIIRVSGTERKEPGHAPCKDGGKFRRLKDGMVRPSRKERSLDADDRDHIIKWWNEAQHLIADDDPICNTLTEEINAAYFEKKRIYPLQVTGYISRLADWGRLTEGHREKKFDYHIKRAQYTIRPVYTPALIQEIIDNYNKQRAEEAIRAAAHEKMRAERSGHAVLETPEPVIEEVSTEEPLASVDTMETPYEEKAPEETEVLIDSIEDEDIEISFD